MANHLKKMPLPNIRDRIKAIAIEQLGRYPDGLRFTQLLRNIGFFDPSLNPSTIKSVVSNLEEISANQVYKPVRGLFRLRAFEGITASESYVQDKRQKLILGMPTKVKALFADWLQHELQVVDYAITPTGNLFQGLCGTPTVLGFAVNPRDHSEPGSTYIVSAQIEVQTPHVISAFGNACASRLFARRCYLVVPKNQRVEELLHLNALCAMFGLGLVLFDQFSVAATGFKLVIRPCDHDPDPTYQSRCIRKIYEQNDLVAFVP